jgi:hypothetical protein
MVVLKLSTWIIRSLPHVTARNKIKLATKYEIPSKRCTLSSSEMLQRKLQPRKGMSELQPCWKRQKGNKRSQTDRILSMLNESLEVYFCNSTFHILVMRYAETPT